MTSKILKLHKLALAIKKGEKKDDNVGNYVLNLLKNNTIKQLESKISQGIQSEATTSASSGSYETPVGFVSKRDMKTLESLKENNRNKTNSMSNANQKFTLTLEKLHSTIKKTVIQEEVYSEKPTTSKTNYTQDVEGKGKEISTKNAKPQKVYDSNAGKSTAQNTKKTGEQAKKASGDSIQKVAAFSKNNLKDAKVKDVNKDKRQTEDQRIEAHQNGMEDWEYENISKEKQKTNRDYLENKKSKSPNSQDTGVNKQVADDAVKRFKSRNQDDKNYRFFGGDVTPNANPSSESKGAGKKIAYENMIPRLNFKTPFKDKKDMLERFNKLPAKYKVNESLIILSDGESEYKIRYEGHVSTNGVPLILEHSNKSQEAADYKKLMRLSEYNTQSSNVSTSKLNEHDMMKQMLNQSRNLTTNIEKSLESIYNPKSDSNSKVNINESKKILKEEYGFTGSIGRGGDNKREDVSAIQVAANKTINAKLKVDGIWGDKTWSAVSRVGVGFSRLVYNYLSDGILRGVGLKQPNNPDDVYKVQILLNSSNLNLGVKLKVDGIFGNQTLSAMQRFVKQNVQVVSNGNLITAFPNSEDPNYKQLVSQALGGRKQKLENSSSIKTTIKEGYGFVGNNNSNDIKAVQLALNTQNPNLKLKVDGILGEITLKAISAYTGDKLGIKSPKISNELMTSYFNNNITQPVGQGQSNNVKQDVAKIQILLNSKNLKSPSNLKVDGIAGTLTLGAITNFIKNELGGSTSVINGNLYKSLVLIALGGRAAKETQQAISRTPQANQHQDKYGNIIDN